jgi:hypothetical protein
LSRTIEIPSIVNCREKELILGKKDASDDIAAAHGPVVLRPNGGTTVLTVPAKIFKHLQLNHGDEAMVTFTEKFDSQYASITFTFIPNNKDIFNEIMRRNWEVAGNEK